MISVQKNWMLLLKQEKSNFSIVIVVDMWITGFDVPCLTYLYNDKTSQKAFADTDNKPCKQKISGGKNMVWLSTILVFATTCVKP